MPIVLSNPCEILTLTGARSSVVTIGNFDGVHAGHRELLRQTSERAKSLNLPAVAITFNPHPETLFSAKPPKSLSSAEQKIELLGQSGMQAVIMLPFTQEFAAMTAAEFCCSVLVESLHTAELFIGYDFHMGSDQASDLEKFGPYTLHKVPAVLYKGEPVSSTRIRAALSESLFSEANDMLGRPFSVRGIVVHGAGRGRPLLGIPTANLLPSDNQVMPPPAAYATSARLIDADGKKNWQKAVTSFSKNPTFNGTAMTIETHILDFDEDIYGHTLEVRFLSKLRSERRFESFQELKRQLHADIAQRREIPL